MFLDVFEGSVMKFCEQGNGWNIIESDGYLVNQWISIMLTKLFVGSCLLYLLLFVHVIQNNPVADGNNGSPVALALKEDRKEKESIFEDKEDEDEDEEEEEEGEEDESKFSANTLS